MDEGWTVIFDSVSRQACNDRALVLTSLKIPYEILGDDVRYMLVVPVEVEEKEGPVGDRQGRLRKGFDLP